MLASQENREKKTKQNKEKEKTIAPRQMQRGEAGRDAGFDGITTLWTADAAALPFSGLFLMIFDDASWSVAPVNAASAMPE